MSEYGAPARIEPASLADYFEVLTKAVFQAGMSWRVVESKWEGFRRAFAGFDPVQIAAFTPEDVERLAADPGIIRNRRKIEATIDNAVELVELDREHGGFRNYLRSHGGFEETAADLRRRFSFLGDTGVYYVLWVVSEPVPSYEEWCKSRGRAPRMT